jgi:beta-glucanase (GH16 family)
MNTVIRWMATSVACFFAAASAFGSEGVKTKDVGKANVAAAKTSNEPAKEYLPPLPAGKKWKLAWSDEFNGTKIDESKWEIFGAKGDVRRRDGYWVKDDAYLDGEGHLILRTKKDGDRYTCGAVRTKGKFEHTYGYWVARCKFPKQQGHWPAFWLHTPTVGKVGNGGKDGTEIDIMEKPWREDRITQNLHWDGYGKDHKHAGTTVEIPGVSEGFHTFGLFWTADEYVFDVDGKETWRSSAGGVSQVPEYAKLTEEIGKWGGDITKAVLPDFFVVDCVRVYDMTD